MIASALTLDITQSTTDAESPTTTLPMDILPEVLAAIEWMVEQTKAVSRKDNNAEIATWC